MRLYLDASPIVYAIEGLPAFRTAALAWIEQAEAAQGAVITSRLSRLECRVKPLREGNSELLERFEGFFSRAALEFVEVSAEVIERATSFGPSTTSGLRMRSSSRVPSMRRPTRS